MAYAPVFCRMTSRSQPQSTKSTHWLCVTACWQGRRVSAPSPAYVSGVGWISQATRRWQRTKKPTRSSVLCIFCLSKKAARSSKRGWEGGGDAGKDEDDVPLVVVVVVVEGGCWW